jgi:hypothetical protein
MFLDGGDRGDQVWLFCLIALDVGAAPRKATVTTGVAEYTCGEAVFSSSFVTPSV